MPVSDRETRMHDVQVDGVRIGERRSELRKPETSYYGQTFVEARSAAGLMVDLGLASIVADIRRREPPFPDVEVCLRDGNSIFIEQTMVMDPAAHRLSMAVEEINIRVNRTAEADIELGYIFNNGAFIIRLDRLTESHLALTLPIDALASEVCALARELGGPVFVQCPESARYPVLTTLDARFSYHPGSRTGAVIHPPMDHGRLHVLAPTLRERLRSKFDKVGTYPASCRPLWLVLDVDHHFPPTGSRLDAAARNIVLDENPHGFDRVIVQQMRHLPIIVESTDERGARQ